MKDSTHKILASLIPMKMEARKSNLLFKHTGIAGNFCGTPEDLDNENSNGRLIWGPANWELVPNDKKRGKLELNFEWIHLYRMHITTDLDYAVRSELDNSDMPAIVLAYRDSRGRWLMRDKTPVPFPVAYVCHIDELTHSFMRGPFAVGDKVEILVRIGEYDKGSVGEIVGKYNRMHTWAIKMEDRFIILLETKDFILFNSKGGG